MGDFSSEIPGGVSAVFSHPFQGVAMPSLLPLQVLSRRCNLAGALANQTTWLWSVGDTPC